MIKTLKALQDVLGRHQDREVQIALLRSLGPEVGAASEGGSRADGDRGADGAARRGRARGARQSSPAGSPSSPPRSSGGWSRRRSNERVGLRPSTDDDLRGRSLARPPRAAALQRRARHERDAQVDPGAVPGRGGGADREPGAAGRGLRGDPGQGVEPRRARLPRGRRPRGVRARVHRARDQGQRDLRARLPAVHRARPAADRQARGAVRTRVGLRHDRPRLHRQGQRPGPDRRDRRHARARAQGDRTGARLADGPRGGGRLRARARDPGQRRHRAGAVLDRRQPVGALERGPLDRGARPRARGRRVPARHPPRGGARRRRSSPWSSSGVYRWR